MIDPARHGAAFRAVPAATTLPNNLVVLLLDDADANREHLATTLGPALARRVVDLMERGQVKGAYKEVDLLPGEGGTEWVLLLGIGSRDELRRGYRRDDRVRSLLAVAARYFRRKGILNFAVADLAWLGVGAERFGRLVAEGVLLGTYRFDLYRAARDAQTELVSVLSGEPDAVQRGLDRGANSARSALFARDLVNTPSSDLRPMDFAREARSLLDGVPGVRVDVLGRRELELEGMGLHLGVSRGSSAEPCTVVVEYTPPGTAVDARWDLVLVGKGVTFDSGGYDLKPSAGMRRMYRDMAGAAAALGAIRAIARAGSPLRAAAVIPLSENMVDGSAFRPGDILRSRKGVTVEIANTDAEGRLLLADALSYATDRFRPRLMVDIATLTGAIRAALGLFVTGLFTHADDEDADQALVKRLVDVGHCTGEWVWRLPVDDDYKVQLGSRVADLANASTDANSGAGAITAAVFLKQFIDFEKVDAWAHLDIAATAFMERTVIYNKVPYWPREGATAVGVRLLAALAEDLAAEG